MAREADVVVAGAGHNSLIAASYLAKAGYSCLVLETYSSPGGGARTEEPLGSGYRIDSCSTGHTLIRVNPLLLADELGLESKYGLTYVDPDPVAHVTFPDGEHLTMWLDLERTFEEIARFSKPDAQAYRRFIADYDAVKQAFGQARFSPPSLGTSLDALLDQLPQGRRWQRIRRMTAWDVIRHEFEERHVQAFLVWMAFQTTQRLDVLGSGPLAHSLVYGRQQRSWSIPLGGSGRLIDALCGFLADHGSEVLCDRHVSRLLLEGGRCVGVETTDGEQYRARHAVLSTIHVKHLLQMAPAEVWPDDFRYAIDTYDLGLSNFCVYMATTQPPRFTTRAGSQTAVSAGLAGWPEDVIRMGRDVAEGRFVEEPPWLLVATPTLVDPGRAPQGQHTVKALSSQTWQLPPGASDWQSLKLEHAQRQLDQLRRVAPNLTDDVIVATLVKCAEDFERVNPHMIRGTWHGGDRGLSQEGDLRPAPGYGHYRMPIDGLYQTGGTTHPGGSITGAPGRNAAWVMLEDLGHSFEAVARAPVSS